MEKLVKSKERVRKLGEVFTPDWVVKKMCDLLQDENDGMDVFSIEKTFLEPSCGTGNFLVEIFRRKLEHCQTPQDGISALESIFGIDIMQDNIEESRHRLFEMFTKKWPDAGDETLRIAGRSLRKNIICGNFLEKKTSCGEPIWFLEG